MICLWTCIRYYCVCIACFVGFVDLSCVCFIILFMIVCGR